MTPDTQAVADLRALGRDALMAEFARRARSRELYRYRPYPWQQAFHDAGATNPHRMIMAANRVGKTRAAGMEAAMHLTGRYPDWWKGKRFDKPTLGWACGVTTESVRDVVQKELLGEEGRHGTGAIPGDDIEKVTYRQAGVSGVADMVRVAHVSGGTSLCVLKSYDQGWRKYQGAAPDWTWLDEEPDDFRIFTECTTRILTSRGVLMVTFTPLLGETELVIYFARPKTGGIHLTGATWADAPHLTEQDKALLLAAYPDYELAARTQGVPMMGSGRVFKTPEAQIVVDPIELPRHWPRINGVDFGIDHPFACMRLAWDRDVDCVYVYDEYANTGGSPIIHAPAVKAAGDWIPVAWPEDGLARDKGSGRPLRDLYAEQNLRMLMEPAQYGDERGKAVEPGILDMDDRMKTGRWKVFRTCTGWLEEYRSYHREDGKIVKVRDDRISASRYALMSMYRFALTKPLPAGAARHRGPILSTRL